MQWFSPRRPKSTWARSNKERVARLEAAGFMTGAGLEAVERARANGSWNSLDEIDALEVPADLAAALEARPGAREHFDAWTASARRIALAWATPAQAARDASRARGASGRHRRARRVPVQPVAARLTAWGRRD
jgi:uncharacterized protein YdeI (YjbR/CyaY-like superfamily)